MVDDGDRFFFQPCFSPVWDTAIGAYALAQSDPRHAALRPRGRLAARTGGPAQGRLVRQAPRDRAFRLGVRIPQRVLSGYRRHRHGAAGALPRRPASDAGAQQACREARARLAAGHAVERRRLGRLRRRQQLGISSATFPSPTTTPCSIPPARISRAACWKRWRRTGLGSQSPAVRARRGMAGAQPASPTEAGTAAGAWPTFTAPVSRCAAWRPPARATARRTSCAPASGCAPFRTPMAAGAKAAPATTTASSPPGPSTPSQTAWAILGLIAGGDTDSLSVRHGIEYLLETQRRDGSWDEELATGTGFPESLLSELPLVQGLFPAAGAVFVREGSRELEWIAYEISDRDDRRPGRIHLQEQDAAASGVAEERRSGR